MFVKAALENKLLKLLNGRLFHLVASSEIFLVRWNKHIFNFGRVRAYS
jgi:hypothetical protein